MVMLSLVLASCSVTTQSWPFLNFPLLVPISSWSKFQLVTCCQFQLVVKLNALIVTFSCIHFVHTFAPWKRHLRCGIYTTHPFVGLVSTACSLLLHSTDCQHTDFRIAISKHCHLQTSHTACLHCTCWRQKQKLIGEVKLADINSSHPPHVRFGSIVWVISAETNFSKWHHFSSVVLTPPSSPRTHDRVQFLSCIW